MKKYLLLIAYLSLGSYCIGQTNTFPASGNVGIGTSTPSAKLHVAGETKTSFISLDEGSTLLGYLGRGLAITGAWHAHPDALTLNYQGRDFIIGGWSKTSSTWMGPSLFIDSDNGNIGIGMTIPSEKLAVNGKIRAKEIKVENANWPDFVFAKSYALPTLKETENHIKEKGHLPGIPSADEVKAHGIDLGDMNAKLLQKIEELTLHLIEKDKTEKKHEEEIRLLKQQVAEIINQIKQ